MAKRKSLQDHVKKKQSTKIKLYYDVSGYRDLKGNVYTHAQGMQMIEEKKAVLPEWKKSKKPKPTYEGGKFTGGRAEGTPNLKRIEGGFQNQHGVTFTTEERKRMESLVNSVNRKRMKMLEAEGNLPRTVGGKETGDTVRSLHLMGTESDFILSRKSKSLQGFKTREAFEQYMKNLQAVNSPTYIDDRTRLYKRNHMQALENVFGHEAKDIIMKIRMMKPEEYRKLIQRDEDLEVSYIYDPSARAGKLNRIRAALGMKEKEDDWVEDI